MIPSSFCSPELLAHIVYEKICQSCDAAPEQWYLPILKKMHEMLFAGDMIHTDEMRIQVLNEEGRKATAESKM